MSSHPKKFGFRHLGINGYDPGFDVNSGPRKAMMAAHLGQIPVIEESEPRRFTTGMETRLSETMFDVRTPADIEVIGVIPRYRVGSGRFTVPHNPMTTVAYEDYHDPDKAVGIIDIPEYLSYHYEFCYPVIKNKRVLDQISPGATIGKDTVLAHSSSLKPHGVWAPGRNVNVAFMSHPGTIEDGFVASESFLESMKLTTTLNVSASWGKKFFPLNLYGDEKHYKIFPDIGEVVREDGILMGTREVRKELVPAEMTGRALRNVDQGFDRLFFVEPGSVVTDIVVYHDDQMNPQTTPTGMSDQPRTYHQGLSDYYTALMKLYYRMKKLRGGKVKITPEFQTRLVEAQIFLGARGEKDRKLTRTKRLEVLDEWYVEITVVKKRRPTMGYKYTDLAGGRYNN